MARSIGHPGSLRLKSPLKVKGGGRCIWEEANPPSLQRQNDRQDKRAGQGAGCIVVHRKPEGQRPGRIRTRTPGIGLYLESQKNQLGVVRSASLLSCVDKAIKVFSEPKIKLQCSNAIPAGFGLIGMIG